MKLRGGTKQSAKGRGAPKSKARKASTGRVSTANFQEQVSALTRELREAREQQTATADVLNVISLLPGKKKLLLEPVLAIALRFGGAKSAPFLLYDGKSFHAPFLHVFPPPYREYWQQHGPIRPGPNTGLARI